MLGIGPIEFLTSSSAFKIDCMRIYFPVDLFPCELHGILSETNKLFNIKRSVEHVVSNDFSMKINENFSICASKFIHLLLGEKIITITSLVHCFRVIFKHNMQFIHIEFAYEFILFISDVIKL